MQPKKLLIALLLTMGMIYSGFQCSSTELTSAKLYIQQKNYDKALESLKKDVAKNPKSDEGYYLLGVVYGELGQYKEMVDALDKSVAISDKFKEDAETLKKYYWSNLINTQGVIFFKKGINTSDQDSSKIYFGKSIDAFETAIMIEPDSAITYDYVSRVYMNVKKYDEAIKPLEILIEKDHPLDSYKFLGEIYYDKASKLKKQYEQSKNVQDSVQAMGYYDKAIKVLEDGTKRYPEDGDILLTLSNSYIGANKIDVALGAFKRGIEQEPDNKYYKYNYGVLLLGANDFAGAEQQFTNAIEIDPNYENAIYNLAVTYVKWGASIAKAAEEKGVSSEEAKQKYQAALPYLEKVVQLRPEESAIWELLGKVYTILGKTDDAKAAFNKADQLRK
ncbi:MAG TPA: tetratricopeptide repeat protein [Ignavibacteriaceae bacterium]|nr:tetratricopeptide repeat protein [Ignavibacteriaceae bacterium]